MTKSILKKRVYTFTSDAGHGWLSVSKDDLKFLCIAKKISGYSYQNGNRAYLEEDDDVSKFFKAYVALIGEEPNIRASRINADYSYIRSFSSYQY